MKIELKKKLNNSDCNNIPASAEMIKINLKTIAEQNGHDNTSSHPISTPTRVTFQTVSNNNHPTAAVSQTRVSTTINSENGGCSVRQTTKTTTASSTNLCRWKFHSVRSTSTNMIHEPPYSVNYTPIDVIRKQKTLFPAENSIKNTFSILRGSVYNMSNKNVIAV